MKVPPFESEYDSDQLPKIDGQPLENKDLDDHVSGMDPWQRVELSQQTLVLDAVESYYLAKRFRETVLPFDGYSNSVVSRALIAVGDKLMRLAVVSIATVNAARGLCPRRSTHSRPHSPWSPKWTSHRSRLQSKT